ncbi:SDR family NAD(P)-dependent oxidoreductase [Prevotella sp.]|uniref:SDR family NAD(P)-dependent oxidoreductase n=1 Tax=Prevotella sp. TaxID=59823 RepID=UPI0025E7C6FD|nr:SDR family oxidoreductase [Prevotella sp.]
MKTVIITGGATGIGLAIAEHFLSNKWQVMITWRNAERLAQVKQELGSKYGAELIDFCQADVANEEEVNALHKKTSERFGKVDAVVNNAGIVIWGHVHEMVAADWDSIFNTNVKGTFINMTRSMAMGYGKYGVRVNCVAPGPTNTSMFPQEFKEAFRQNSPLWRIVEPEKIAKAVFFMATDASSAITGETIPVTAGFEISTGQPRMID